MQIQPYLVFSGVEIANFVRTAQYLQKNLGRPNILVPSSIGSVQPGGGYSNLYADTYSADPLDPIFMDGYCKSFDFGPYVSPAADPAPWYTARRPESGEFLGLILTDADLNAPLTRNVSARAARGAIVGRRQQIHRIISCTGILYASTQRGMEWGERWLTTQLTPPNQLCDQCELDFFPFCPSNPADTTVMRRLMQCGTVNGPQFSQVHDRIPMCYMQGVLFQMAAGEPHMLSNPVTYALQQQLLLASSVTALVQASQGVEAGIRIVIDAGTVGGTVSGVTIKGTPAASSCPTPDTAATVSYTISRLERGTQLVIDPALRQVLINNIATSTSPGGLDALTFSGLWQWMDMVAGDSWCVNVSAPAGSIVNPGTSVTIQRVDAEL